MRIATSSWSTWTGCGPSSKTGRRWLKPSCVVCIAKPLGRPRRRRTTALMGGPRLSWRSGTVACTRPRRVRGAGAAGQLSTRRTDVPLLLRRHRAGHTAGHHATGAAHRVLLPAGRCERGLISMRRGWAVRQVAGTIGRCARSSEGGRGSRRITWIRRRPISMIPAAFSSLSA